MREIKNIVVENARIVFKNFSGEERQFNPKGKRNFCLLISPDDADRLKAEGWNIKALKAREEGDMDQPYLPVEVRYGQYPPKVVMVTSKNQTVLDEEMVAILDTAEITNVDVVVRPFEWEPGRLKAYVKTMYVTIAEDEFESKYETPAPALNTEDDLW